MTGLRRFHPAYSVQLMRRWLAVCLLPLVRLGVQYLVYKAAAFLAGILGAEQLTGLIDALGGAFGLIFGMTGACGLLLLISISSALGVVTG